MEVTTQNILEHYPRVQYRASDGQFYPLKKLYPICLGSTTPGVLYLDTGGPMGEDAEFFEIRVISGRLQKRYWSDQPWLDIPNDIRIEI